MIRSEKTSGKTFALVFILSSILVIAVMSSVASCTLQQVAVQKVTGQDE